jgi:hypothetical protein
MAHVPPAGPAAGTRGAAAKSSQRASSPAPADHADDRAAEEGKAGDEDPAAAAAAAEADDADAPEAAAPDHGVTVADMFKEMQAMRDELKKLKQQQQLQQPQPLSLHASSSSPPPDPRPAAASNRPDPSPQPQAASAVDVVTLVRALQEGQARQAQQQLVLRSLGELPTFSGKGADTTLIAQEWLQRAERFFAIRERTLGIDAALGDEARLLDAAYALQDDARRWYDALPQPPSTWTGFRDAVKARFCSVPSERIRLDRLREFVEKASRVREKLNVQGMQVYSARFAQLAGEVSARFLTDHNALELLSRGLPQRYAEVVAKEDAKEPPPPLHEVINAVLARASQKEQVASYGGASSSSGSSAPSNIDAISLAAVAFGWTREEAQAHMGNEEGWAPHDTSGGSKSSSSGSSSGPASSGSPTPASPLEEKFDRLLAAFAAQGTKVGAGPAARERNSRRNAPSGVLKELPRELAESRKKAGLCIKCGVAKYEPGGHGHNAVTCKAAADKTTSAEEGRKKANF